VCIGLLVTLNEGGERKPGENVDLQTLAWVIDLGAGIGGHSGGVGIRGEGLPG